MFLDKYNALQDISFRCIIANMARINKTKYIILGMLAIRPMSGYEIHSTIKKTTANFWSESAGQIYPNLAALLKDGAVACEDEANDSKHNSKIYSLTKKGLGVLQEWLPTPATRHPPRDELLLKLFFGKNMAEEECQKLILQRQRKAEENLEFLTSTKKHLEQQHKNREDFPYWLITIDHGIFTTQAEIAWCDAILKNLKKSLGR
ncbi:MAG: PadR family transcriptional regulator [Gammaproteobacteria bacterium]